VPGPDRAELIELLDRDGTVTAIAAADELRAGAEFTAEISPTLPGEHFAKIYRRRRDHTDAVDLDVRGLDEAIARFERADEIGELAIIDGAHRRYSVFMSPGPASAVVACLSTPAE